jgi:probable addiction module antidote protein
MELENKSALLIALRQVAKAHGIAEVACNASLGEKTLFKSLSDDGNPTLDTMNRILHSVGLRLSVAASHA